MRITCLAVVLMAPALLAAEGAEFHVASGGDDVGPGDVDRPFASLERAQLAVRELQRAQPATVFIHEGTYRLAEPLVFTPEDSGTEGAPVVWRAYEDEKPVISGGVPITGWGLRDDRLWVADVPWAREREEGFCQLFVNGVRRPRARVPNEGEYLYSKRLHMDGDQCVGLTFREGDLGPWAGEGDAQIVLFHNWVNSYNRIGEADWDRRRIRFARPAGIFFLGPSVRYYLENVLAALDSPGEWYLEQAAGLVYYYPMPDEDMATAEVIAPVVPVTLVELRGDPRIGLYVEHIAFEGISFQHTDADLSPDYQHSVQGAVHQRGAILATGAHNCRIERCEFTRLGENAVSLREGCQHNVIVGNHMHDLGSGGVYLSEGAPAVTEDWYLTAYNVVDNNFIHDGGHIVRAGCGVFLGGSASYNQITHNEICDLSWMGVHLGWSWTGRAPAYTHHNEVGYNHIHHLGNGVLNDIGGIYTLGVSPGTVLHHNLIHDVTRFERGDEGYGGWGIYLDAGSSEMVVENNVVYNTRDGGLHLHCFGHPYGDIVRNNIFAYSDEGQMMRNADHEPEGNHAHIERNIVYGGNTRMLWGSNWAPDSHFTAGRNLYWSEAGEPEFNGMTLGEWQATGRDVDGLVADPLFVDAAGRDFTQRPDSPAFDMGFEPIDLSTVGLTGPDDWRTMPQGITHRAFEAAPPPEDLAGPIFLDFEDYEVGEAPDGAIAPEGGAEVVISDHEPASGHLCLRFVDAPDATGWKPHWFTWRTPGEGPVRVACLVRNDPVERATFDLELRDWPRDAGVRYATGPYLRFFPDGSVSAGGPGWTEIASFEPGIWLQVEIEFEEGDGRAGTYAVRIGQIGGEMETVEGLPPRSEEFRACNWVGFSGAEQKRAVFYVDDVLVE